MSWVWAKQNYRENYMCCRCGYVYTHTTERKPCMLYVVGVSKAILQKKRYVLYMWVWAYPYHGEKTLHAVCHGHEQTLCAVCRGCEQTLCTMLWVWANFMFCMLWVWVHQYYLARKPYMLHVMGVTTTAIFWDSCEKRYGCGHTHNIQASIFTEMFVYEKLLWLVVGHPLYSFYTSL